MSLESAPYPCTARVCQLALTVSMNAGRNTSVDSYGLTPETRECVERRGGGYDSREGMWLLWL